MNANVIPGVDPSSKAGYIDALLAGVAHANTSFFPDQDGTVYLFSHSTNYDWFVKDLNAVFYLVKNLEADDVIVVLYKNKRYTYKITSKKVVSPKNISYLIPYAGKKEPDFANLLAPWKYNREIVNFRGSDRRTK